MLKFITLLFLSGVALSCSDSHADSNPRRHRIGIIAPLSGDISAWGIDVKNTLMFANDKVDGEKFELVFEDDQCLSRNAVTAAHKLIEIDHVDFAIVVCSESMVVTAPIFDKAKTLAIAVVGSGASISQAGEYIFRTWPSDEIAAALLARHIAKKIRYVGVISESRGFELEFEQSFLRGADTEHLRAKTVQFQSGETDFRSLLLRLKSAGIEGLFINTANEQSHAAILKQAREFGISVPIYGAYTPGNKRLQQLAGNLADGIIYVDAPSAADSFTSEGKKLYSEFVQSYPPLTSPEFVFASTYEALRIFKENVSNKVNLPSRLTGSKHQGIFGDYFFDKNGDVNGVEHKLKKISQGNDVLIY